MDTKKSTNANGHTLSDFDNSRLNSRDTNNIRDVHDRPAIFIEKPKHQNHYNRSRKSN